LSTDQEVADLREAMVQTLIEGVDGGLDLVVVVSDSTSTSKIAPFAERFPHRVVNVGIAEQNLVGVAAGLALGGMVPVTANAAPFLVARAHEQVKNDVCYSEANVKLVGLNAGVSYGPLASTHHAIADVAVMRGMGNVQIYAPADSVEASAIFRYALGCTGPVYIRLDNARLPVLHSGDYVFEPGRVDRIRPGVDVTLCAMGSVVCEAVEAAEDLAASGVDAEVLNISSLRPVDRGAIARSVAKTGRAITVEEHVVTGGLGSLVAEVIADCGLPVQLCRLGIPEGEFSVAGPRKEIRRHYGIDRAGVVRAVAEMALGGNGWQAKKSSVGGSSSWHCRGLRAGTPLWTCASGPSSGMRTGWFLSRGSTMETARSRYASCQTPRGTGHMRRGATARN